VRVYVCSFYFLFKYIPTVAEIKTKITIDIYVYKYELHEEETIHDKTSENFFIFFFFVSSLTIEINIIG